MHTCRFDLFFEKHLGIGLRWDASGAYQLHLSLALPFVTITIGIGRNLNNRQGGEVEHG